MKHFAPLRVRLEKDLVTRVTRSLSGKGTFQVRVGQQVTPSEIIGNAVASAGFRILNLATLLSVPPREVANLLVKKMNEKIYKGELLAFKKGGLFGGSRVVTAPTDGILEFLNNKTGELRLAFFPKKVDLLAGVYGIVEELDEERGQATIKTQASRIYGMFGSGRSRDGTLHILGKKDDLVTASMIQAQYEGSILVGGGFFFKGAISVAISTGINGLITGGMDALDYRGMAGGRLSFPKKLETDVGISVIVCEGFGSVPLGDDIFKTLSEYEGKFVFIDGNKALISLPSYSSSCVERVKNTVLPPLRNDDSALDLQSAAENSELQPGLKVRIVGTSYLGEQGKLLAVDNSLTLLPSGIRSYMATVETSRRKIQVPVANLEIIM